MSSILEALKKLEEEKEAAKSAVEAEIDVEDATRDLVSHAVSYSGRGFHVTTPMVVGGAGALLVLFIVVSIASALLVARGAAPVRTAQVPTPESVDGLAGVDGLNGVEEGGKPESSSATPSVPAPLDEPAAVPSAANPATRPTLPMAPAVGASSVPAKSADTVMSPAAREPAEESAGVTGLLGEIPWRAPKPPAPEAPAEQPLLVASVAPETAPAKPLLSATPPAPVQPKRLFLLPSNATRAPETATEIAAPDAPLEGPTAKPAVSVEDIPPPSPAPKAQPAEENAAQSAGIAIALTPTETQAPLPEEKVAAPPTVTLAAPEASEPIQVALAPAPSSESTPASVVVDGVDRVDEVDMPGPVKVASNAPPVVASRPEAAVPAPAPTIAAPAPRQISTPAAVTAPSTASPRASTPAPSPARKPDLASLPLLTDSVKERYGIRDLKLNMPRPASPSRPHASAIINLRPVFEGEYIPGTRAKLHAVDGSDGVALDLGGELYYLEF